MINVSVDAKKVNRKLQRLQEGLSHKQVASALDSSLQSTRSYASRVARSFVNLKAKDIYENVRTNTKGDSILMYKTSHGQLNGYLLFTSYRHNIAFFGARSRKKGAAVTTWRHRGVQHYPSAWQKKTKPGAWFRRLGPKRIPYESISGPSMAEVIEPVKILITDFAEERMGKEYMRKLRGLVARG